MSLAASIGRMSQREKLLVGTLVFCVLGGVIGIFHFLVFSEVSALEEQIETDRSALREIYQKSDDFVAATQATNAMRVFAARNADLNLKLAVNEVAKRISFQARNRRGEIEGNKKLADVMQFDQTQETFLSKKKKRRKGKKKKDSDVGYYRRDQPITLSDTVPFKAIYDLMEKIEEADDLLYVTEFEVTRDFQDGRNARKNAQIVVSTYYYKGPSEEPDDDSPKSKGKGEES